MPTIVSTGQITIVDVNDGLSAALTAASAVLPADASGTVTSYAGAETTLKITEGGADTSSEWVYYVSATGGGVAWRDSDDTADKTVAGTLLGALGGSNLREDSEAFDSASWIKSNVSVAPNNVTAPDGTLTADIATGTANLTSVLVQSKPLSLNTTYTDSVYVKPLGANKIVGLGYSTGAAGTVCNFNLASMTADTGGMIETLANGWFRVAVTYTTAASGTPFANHIWLGGTITPATAVQFALWGAQLEVASSVGSYRASGSTVRSGVPGYLKITALTQDLSWLDITAARSGQPSLTRRFSVARAVNGTRGTRQLYLTNAAYIASYGAAAYAAAATAAIASATAGSTPTMPLKGDTVTFTNGTSYATTYTCTVAGASPTWALPGTVIDGSLLVTGTVTALAVNAVKTVMIEGNAVTVPVSVDHTLKTGNGAWQSAVTASLSLAVASPIQVIYSCVQGYSGATPITRFRISHNGVTVPYLYDSGNNAGINTNPVASRKATGVVGVNTVLVEWYAATSVAAIDQGNLFLTGLQK